MKYLFSVLLTFVLSEGLSQEKNLFKIITHSRGVTIDGNAVVVGQDVTTSSKTLQVPGGGYCGVATSDGILLELKTTIAVTEVNDFVKKRASLVLRSGAPKRPLPASLQFPMDQASNKHLLYGDSLFLVWWENGKENRVKGVDYEVKITDRYEDEIEKMTLRHNWCFLNANKYLEGTKLAVVSIRSGKTKSKGSIPIARIPAGESKLPDDLSHVNDKNDLALLCAVFELNGFIHDRNYLLYRIMRGDQQPSGLLKTYVDRYLIDLDLK